MIYLSFGDVYSGVYQSQVIEVCEYLSQLSGKPSRLIAFVPYPLVKDQKLLLKSKYPQSWVFPMFPAHLHLWKMFVPLLAFILLFVKSRKLICRGTIACTIGLGVKRWSVLKKVIYDGRGAEKEEWREYEVGGAQKIKNDIAVLERKSVLKADFRIAVSNKLLEYWENEFGYHRNEEVIIPCTLAKSFLKEIRPSETEIRYKYGFSESDIVLVYSGSTAGWQSFQLLNKWFEEILLNNSKVKILFLSKKQAVEQLPIYMEFHDRIVVDWLKPEDVYSVLCACDYGVLFREDSVTNKVASPTKFAEYLASGLKVLISERIGDYSALVSENEIGQVIRKKTAFSIVKLDADDKKVLHSFGIQHFSKSSFEMEYLKLINL